MAQELCWSKATTDFDASQVEDLGMPNVSVDIGANAVIVSAVDEIGDARVQGLDVVLRSQGFKPF